MIRHSISSWEMLNLLKAGGGFEPEATIVGIQLTIEDGKYPTLDVLSRNKGVGKLTRLSLNDNDTWVDQVFLLSKKKPLNFSQPVARGADHADEAR